MWVYHSCTDCFFVFRICYIRKREFGIHKKGINMEQENRNKDGKTYNIFSNLKFHMHSAKRWNKKLFYFQILGVIPGVISGFAAALLPAMLVAALEQKREVHTLVLLIIGLGITLWICDMIYETMRTYLYRNSMALTLYYDKLCFQKIMKIDYDRIESQDSQRLIGNVWNVLRNEYAVRNSVTDMPQLFVAILSSVWFGVMIAKKSPLIIGLLSFSVLVNFRLLFMVGKIHKQKEEEISIYAREVNYINRQAMEKTAGKDIRLYQMQDWFLRKYSSSLKAMNKIYTYIHNCYFLRSIGEQILLYISEIVSYGYLLYLLFKGELSASQVVLYIGLIEAFTSQFSTLIYLIMTMIPFNTSITYIRQFLDMKERSESGKVVLGERLNEIKKNGVKVEFKNVSFTYPGKEEATLQNINLIIEPNEKLAIIGLNGAGKTTLVKLLCGFYKPTTGEILINNISAEEYMREEYEELLSVLFQDSGLLPLTLDMNLTGQNEAEIDRKRLKHALGLSGFFARYNTLSKKGNTLLVREVCEGATDFSGGEKQKLLFARALYKKAPLLILDEPTAALDPIAENELYEKYGTAAQNRTSIFISHRLSSTRFCDRIILLENAEIKEEGTHEELMKLNGRYAKLYELQSKYYREENRKEEVASDEQKGLESCMAAF